MSSNSHLVSPIQIYSFLFDRACRKSVGNLIAVGAVNFGTRSFHLSTNLGFNLMQHLGAYHVQNTR